MKRIRLALILAAAFALVILLAAACESPDQTLTTQGDGGQPSTSTPGGSQTATGSSAGSAGTGDAVPGATSIPPGSSFAEGGGGPKSYTFREEWRRAAEVAKKWRSGAFLVTASGRFVNNQGVPNGWSMMFVDAIPTDEILYVNVDPWGAITEKKAIKTAERTDQLQPGDAQIPFGIMDSDAAIAKSRAALAAVGGSEEGNARLTLAFARDHTGPYWTCMVEGPGSKASVVRVDAMTGETKVISQ